MAKRGTVWNTDPNSRSFYELNAKGDAVAYHSVLPGGKVTLPKHECDRLIADGGWTDTDPAAKDKVPEPETAPAKEEA